MQSRDASEPVAMETTPIAYAIKRRHAAHRSLCLACCGGHEPDFALRVYDSDKDRATFGVVSDDKLVTVCHGCGERMDAQVRA